MENNGRLCACTALTALFLLMTYGMFQLSLPYFHSAHSAGRQTRSLQRRKLYLPEGWRPKKLSPELAPSDLKVAVSPYALDFVCADVRRFGGPRDGGWNVCFENGKAFSRPCLVYSFGVGGDWTFDMAISEYLGCEVHSFDMTMPINTNVPESRTANVTFHHLGLSGADAVETKTLKTIRKMLGHWNATIDYLKIDIEGHEWSSLQTALTDGSLDGVQHLGMEVHLSYMPHISNTIKLGVLRGLTRLGFALYDTHANPYDFNCWELHYTQKRRAV